MLGRARSDARRCQASPAMPGHACMHTMPGHENVAKIAVKTLKDVDAGLTPRISFPSAAETGTRLLHNHVQADEAHAVGGFQVPYDFICKRRLGNLQDGPEGPWQLKQGYAQVFGYIQVFGSPTGATHGCLSMPRRLDPQSGPHTSVWNPNRGYSWMFGSPARGLHTSVWSPNRGYTWVLGVPNGRLCKLPVHSTYWVH